VNLFSSFAPACFHKRIFRPRVRPAYPSVGSCAYCFFDCSASRSISAISACTSHPYSGMHAACPQQPRSDYQRTASTCDRPCSCYLKPNEPQFYHQPPNEVDWVSSAMSCTHSFLTANDVHQSGNIHVVSVRALPDAHPDPSGVNTKQATSGRWQIFPLPAGRSRVNNKQTSSSNSRIHSPELVPTLLVMQPSRTPSFEALRQVREHLYQPLIQCMTHFY